MSLRYDITAIQIGLQHILDFKPRNIIELGSRDGHDTKHIGDMFNIPHNQRYIMEAHPELCSNIEQMYKNYNVYNCAVSNKTEPITFNAVDLDKLPGDGMSSVLPIDDKDWPSNPIIVDGWRVDDICNNIGLDYIDLVKIDVEGYTLEVLEGFGDMLSKTKCMQIELEHEVPTWKGQALYDDVKSYLVSNGFIEIVNMRMCYDQSDSLWVQQELIKDK